MMEVLVPRAAVNDNGDGDIRGASSGGRMWNPHIVIVCQGRNCSGACWTHDAPAKLEL